MIIIRELGRIKSSSESLTGKNYDHRDIGLLDEIAALIAKKHAKN